MADDLRYELRQMRAAPLFTAVVTVTCAIAIGATSAMFTVIAAVLIRPLPYSNPDRLVRIIEHPVERTNDIGYQQSLAAILTNDLPAFRSQAPTLSHVAVYLTDAWTVTNISAAPVRADGARVSPAVFDMLGVRPVVGRTFTSDEEAPSAEPVVVVSHTFWEQFLGGDRNVLERQITLDGNAFTIVGVMPREFRFPDSQTLFWIPYTLGGRGSRLPPIARLADGVTLDQAVANVDTVLRQLHASEPRRPGVRPAASTRFELQTVQDQLVAPVRTPLIVLSVAVVFVALIACVNVTNLLLAKNTVRRHELAVRVALGAGPARLTRQFLTETLLLAAIGGIGGVVIALGAVNVLRVLGSGLPRRDLTPGVSIPRLEEVAVDGTTLLFAALTTVLVGVVVGLLPVVRMWISSNANFGHQGMTRVSGVTSSPHHPAQGMLVVAEISLATLSLIGAGLLLHSFVRLSRVEPGYEAANLMTFVVRTSSSRTASSFHDEVTQRLQGLPGVIAVGYAELLPMVRFRVGGPVKAAQPMPPETPPPPAAIDQRIVSQDFVRAMGMRIIEGRSFREDDGPGVLINETLARSGFLGPKPVGMRVYPTARPVSYEVIGIVEDVRQYGLDQEPDPQMFIDVRHLPMGNPSPYFAVRLEREPRASVSTIREALRQVDASAVLDNVATMEQIVSNSISRPRLFAVLGGMFAAIGALLGAIGIYGVIAYSLAQRTREFGIRLAVGARPLELAALVIRQGAHWSVTGLAIGIAGAVALTRYMEGVLFGVTPLDATTIIVVSALFFLVSMIATFVPTRRATVLDPIVALRSE